MKNLSNFAEDLRKKTIIIFVLIYLRIKIKEDTVFDLFDFIAAKCWFQLKI